MIKDKNQNFGNQYIFDIENIVLRRMRIGFPS
jgi:hypothetical protein